MADEDVIMQTGHLNNHQMHDFIRFTPLLRRLSTGCGTAAVVVLAGLTWGLSPMALADPAARPAGPVGQPATLGPGTELAGVAATSASNAWAVGDVSAPGSNKTLILRWNGSSWAQVPSPSPGRHSSLDGVTAISASNAWAVGVTSLPGLARTLILHWDGSTWSRVPSPSPAATTVLTSVTAVHGGGVWAVGFLEDPLRPLRPLILRWNGRAWITFRKAPQLSYSRLDSVAATSADNAWAVGSGEFGSSLILHWNGSAWERVPSPSPAFFNSFNGVAATSGRNAWAVGQAAGNALIAHWNGRVWTRVPSPAGAGVPFGVTASSGGTWAVGSSNNGSVIRPVIMRWTGHAWQRVRVSSPLPGASLLGVAAPSAVAAWAVGFSEEGAGPAVLLTWNGQKWS
jgi:hypothetical protein